MRRIVSLSIPQPCSESWAAMTPTATGRHCAACAQTVVDFTQRTDAEILAYLAGAASGRTCGRFVAGQLERPLQRAVLAAPTRWRAWLAAAVAVWSLREGPGLAANAQVPTAQAHYSRKRPGRPVPLSSRPALRIRGVVRDSATGEPLLGAAVFLKGENLRAATDSAGRFSLRLPAGWRSRPVLIVHLVGYQSQTITVPANAQAAGTLAIELRIDASAAGVEITGKMPIQHRQIIGGSISMISVSELAEPKSNPLRNFYNWLTRPFRRS